jgi:hypothetical protein
LRFTAASLDPMANSGHQTSMQIAEVDTAHHQRPERGARGVLRGRPPVLKLGLLLDGP